MYVNGRSVVCLEQERTQECTGTGRKAWRQELLWMTTTMPCAMYNSGTHALCVPGDRASKALWLKCIQLYTYIHTYCIHKWFRTANQTKKSHQIHTGFKKTGKCKSHIKSTKCVHDTADLYWVMLTKLNKRQSSRRAENNKTMTNPRKNTSRSQRVLNGPVIAACWSPWTRDILVLFYRVPVFVLIVLFCLFCLICLPSWIFFGWIFETSKQFKQSSVIGIQSATTPQQSCIGLKLMN